MGPPLSRQARATGDWGYPEWYAFHYFDDDALATSMKALDEVLSREEGVVGSYEAFQQLGPFAFKVDLWRYAMLYACGGVYVDSKMRLQTKFGPWADRHLLKLEHRPPHLRFQAHTCVDATAEGKDKRRGPVMWQGFIMATPRVRQLLWAIEYIVENVKRRYYPHEGHLSMLYVTGPGALGRTVMARRICHNATAQPLGKFRHTSCQRASRVRRGGGVLGSLDEARAARRWGAHGAELRGNPHSERFYELDRELHESMRGNVGAFGRPAMNSYGDWFKQHRAYGEPLDEARYPHPQQGRVPYFYFLENETACGKEGRSGADCATYGCDAFGCGEAVGGVHLACPMDSSAAAAAALRKQPESHHPRAVHGRKRKGRDVVRNSDLRVQSEGRPLEAS